MSRQVMKKRLEEEEDKLKTVNMVLKYGGGGMIVFLILALGLELFNAMTAVTLVHVLDGANAEKLQDAFFGGDAHVIICSDSHKATVENGGLRPSFIKTASILQSQLPWVEFNTIHCGNKLPSGKTIYERLSLQTHKTPVMFLAIGSEKPTQIEPQLLKKAKGEETPKLVKYLTDTISKRAEFVNIAGAKALETGCIDRKACILVIGPDAPAQAKDAYPIEMRMAHSIVKWRTLDSLKFSTNLVEVFGKRNEARVLFFSKKHYAIATSEEDIEEFLEKGLEGKLEMKTLEKIPKMKRVTKKSKTHASPQKKKKKASSTRPTTTTPKEEEEEEAAVKDTKLHMTREEAAQWERERDRERQEQMEKEANAIFDYEDDEEDEEGDTNDEGYHTEEEIVL